MFSKACFSDAVNRQHGAPLPQDHVLWSLPNVIITPHVAAASPGISERHLATLLENVRSFSEGEPISTLVDKAQWF